MYTHVKDKACEARLDAKTKQVKNVKKKKKILEPKQFSDLPCYTILLFALTHWFTFSFREGKKVSPLDIDYFIEV